MSGQLRGDIETVHAGSVSLHANIAAIVVDRYRNLPFDGMSWNQLTSTSCYFPPKFSFLPDFEGRVISYSY